jgi:hypothetical protein
MPGFLLGLTCMYFLPAPDLQYVNLALGFLSTDAYFTSSLVFFSMDISSEF